MDAIPIGKLRFTKDSPQTQQERTNIKIKFRNDQHSMFPTMLDSCELNNVFSTNFLNHIRSAQRTMLCLCGNWRLDLL